MTHILLTSISLPSLVSDVKRSISTLTSPTYHSPPSHLTHLSMTIQQRDQQHNFITKNSHIKRPRNTTRKPTIRTKDISKHISDYWARLSSKQEIPWHVLAEHEKLAHQEAFLDTILNDPNQLLWLDNIKH
ncbi:hypothetical protein BC941DRAFT_515821 [Chlamydoabsidia padenii]|nr:hypothetical protein BC941DRAFT_515821 [Chlamydoabsidia padenii]